MAGYFWVYIIERHILPNALIADRTTMHSFVFSTHKRLPCTQNRSWNPK